MLGTALVLLLLGGAGTASAHAALRATDPEDASVLKSAPRHLTLTFTESVALLDGSVRVLDPDGRRLRLTGTRHAPDSSDTVMTTLPAKLANGTYVVAWRVVSADSHPVSGAFTFSVGKASATAAVIDPGPVEDPATEALYNTARYLAYLALALLVGITVFLTVCRPPHSGPLRRPLWAGYWILLGSTLALLLLRAPYESGAGPTAAFDAAAFTRVLSTRPGVVLLARLALLAPVALFLVRLLRRGTWSRGRAATGAALSAALALTWAAGEHASAGIQVPVAMTSSALHVLATAVWLGGLVALLLTLYRAPSITPATVARFSRLAFASVVVLVVTGVYQSWRGLGSWSALTGTSYGRLLVAKLAVVALLLAAARASRRWTARLALPAAEVVPARVPASVGASAPTPPGEARQGLPPADLQRRGLRSSVLAEVAVGALVLVITTVLTATLPGRAAEEAAASAAASTGGVVPTSVTYVPFAVANASGKVQVTLDPGRTGDNSVEAVVIAPDGGPSVVPELRISFTLPARDIGPIDAGVTDRGGYWSTSSLTLPLAGDWLMKVTVRVSDIDQVTETAKVTIR